MRLFYWQVSNTVLFLYLKNIPQKLTEFAFGKTYLHQTFTDCVSKQNISFLNINMPDMTTCNGMLPKFNYVFFGIFLSAPNLELKIS